MSRIPRYACHVCHTLVPEDAPHCLECEIPRPPKGWLLVGDAYLDPFLGEVLRERYLLSKPVGRGASGRVYRAEALTIPRRFAVKIIELPGAAGSPEAALARERIRREADATLSLRNPHIIQVYDIFDVDAYHVALVMEFIDGATLQELVEREGPLDALRAIRIARQVANGLYEAHQNGLIHRDVKPENIMIERMPAGDEFVHILDFGIVWARGEAHTTQGFMGTPLYASPDQVLDLELDARSDIYSLGATLFFMLAGRPPFEKGTPVKILRDHVKERPPSLLSLRADGEGLAELDLLVRTLLAKDREERPGSLRAVIAELDAVEHILHQSGPHPSLRRRAAPRAPRAHHTCESCAVLNPPPSQSGRSGSDVACMAEFSMQGVRTMRGLVASVAQSRVGMVDTHNRVIWGSLLVPDNLMTSEPLPARINRVALANSATWVGTADGKVLRLEASDSTGHVEFADEHSIRALDVDPNENVVAFVTEDGRVYIRRNYRNEAFQLLGAFEGAMSVSVSPSGNHIAVGHKLGKISLYYTASMERVPEPAIEAGAPIACLAFSNDDYLLAALTTEGRVVVHAPQMGLQIMSLGAFAEEVRDIAFSARNNLMAICVEDERIFLLDLQCRHATQCTPRNRNCHLEH